MFGERYACKSHEKTISNYFLHVANMYFSEDFALLVTFLLVTFSWLFRGPHLIGKTVFGPFSWLFHGFFVAFSWPSFWSNFTRKSPRKVFWIFTVINSRNISHAHIFIVHDGMCQSCFPETDLSRSTKVFHTPETSNKETQRML